MSKLNHLFKVGQEVRVNLDGKFHKGTVKQTEEDYIIIDVENISDHCYFDNDMMDMVYPDYNFNIA